MRKNEDRKIAEQAFLSDRGRITNKEIAKRLDVHPATVARWKKLDEWDRKLVQMVHDPRRSGPETDILVDDEDFFKTDMKQLVVLNERIETYLQKRELLPSEILELAEAKYHIMSCWEIINERMRYSSMEQFTEEQHTFD